jgi:hypothetical protein
MISVPDDFLEKDKMHLSLFLFKAISFIPFTTNNKYLAIKNLKS